MGERMTSDDPKADLKSIRPTPTRGSTPNHEGILDPLRGEVHIEPSDPGRCVLGADGALHTPLGSSGLERTKELIPSGTVEIGGDVSDTTGEELFSDTEYGVITAIGAATNAAVPGLKNASAAAAAGNIFWVGASIAAGAYTANPLTSLVLKGPVWGYRSSGTGTLKFNRQLWVRE